MRRDLSRLSVLVTGASQGIGLATTRHLCEHDAHAVYAISRDVSSLEELAATHPSLHPVSCDVRDSSALDALFARISREQGRLDVLVNNASILGPISQIEDHAWREAIDINLNGPFLVTRRALPLLQESSSPPALILNLSSSVGRKARALWGAYSVSKFGVEGLTALLADELPPDQIASASLNPGGTATAMRALAYPEEDPSSLPSPAQVAQTIALLIELLGPEQSGARYSSRSLFDALSLAETIDDAATLPRDP